MKLNKQGGFIKLVILIIAIIFILSYFGISLRNIANSETGQDNLGFLKELGIKIWDFCTNIWNQYLADKVAYVWNDIFLKYIWSFITENIDKVTK